MRLAMRQDMLGILYGLTSCCQSSQQRSWLAKVHNRGAVRAKGRAQRKTSITIPLAQDNNVRAPPPPTTARPPPPTATTYIASSYCTSSGPFSSLSSGSLRSSSNTNLSELSNLELQALVESMGLLGQETFGTSADPPLLYGGYFSPSNTNDFMLSASPGAGCIGTPPRIPGSPSRTHSLYKVRKARNCEPANQYCATRTLLSLPRFAVAC
jgi:hypothetical protein